MDTAARRLAHDLNNVAFVISGYAQRLEESIPESDPRREDVNAILQAAPRLTEIVSRLRALGTPSPEDARRKLRILLVEDETSVRELLKAVLTRRGYHVDVGCTGDEGLALCDSLEPPDLLITD